MSPHDVAAPGTSVNDVQIDPRGYRFGAAVTLVFAAAAILFVASGGLLAAALMLTVLVAMFFPGATIGPQATVQSAIFKALIRPRLGPPAFTESFRPPRFAQQMGLAMSLAGAVMAWITVAGLAPLAWGIYLWAGFVLFASFLNSVFGFCLGCEIYLVLRRMSARRT